MLLLHGHLSIAQYQETSQLERHDEELVKLSKDEIGSLKRGQLERYTEELMRRSDDEIGLLEKADIYVKEGTHGIAAAISEQAARILDPRKDEEGYIVNPEESPTPETIDLIKQCKNSLSSAQCVNLKPIEDFVTYYDSEQADKCSVRAKQAIYNEQTIDVIANYLRECAIEKPDQSTSVYKEAIDRTGVIQDQTGTVFCSGYLIDSSTVITARHCNLDEKLSSPTIIFKSNISSSKFKIRDTSCGGVHESLGTRSHQACDYIFLELEKSVEFMPKITISDNQSAYQPAVLIGHNIFVQKLFLHSQPNKYEPAWSDGLSLNDSPLCFIDTPKEINAKGAKTMCFTHTCQSYKGTSGAPIFSRIGNKIEFLGINIGANTRDKNNWLPLDGTSYHCEYKPNADYVKINNIGIFFKQLTKG